MGAPHDGALPLRRDRPASGQRLGIGQWSITIAATIVSTYALDLFATAAGIALVASGVLAPADRVALLLALGVTYLLWGMGLRASLAANWALLERTSTSSNALSKAAYDVVRMRTGRMRLRRTATAVGYLGTELLKEVPYYAGAVGAAYLTQSITAHDALVFLCGTNLGAAGYEFGLAHSTHWFLRRTTSSRAGLVEIRRPGPPGQSVGLGEQVDGTIRASETGKAKGIRS